MTDKLDESAMTERAPAKAEDLERILRDMVELTAMPAVWASQEIGQTAEDLAEAVQRTLALDLAWVRVLDPAGAAVCRCRLPGDEEGDADAVGRTLAPYLGDPGCLEASIPHPLAAGTLRLAISRFGFSGQAGALVAGSSRPGFPDGPERQLLTVAANQAAIAFQHKLVEKERLALLEREREAHREAQTLNDLAQTLGGELDVHRLVQKITDVATELTAAKFGSFFYNAIDDEGESYLLYTLCGAPREAFEKLGYPRNTLLFGPTFRGEGAVRIADVLADPRYGKSSPHFGMPKGHLPVRSYLAVPVVARSGEVLGGLFFGHPETGIFTAQAERLALGLASHAAIAIDNARLYRQAQVEIAERRRIEDSERAARTEAERASRLRDEFLATVSHELRNPLNSVLGWTQVLRRVPGDEEARDQAIEAIERGARAQIRLIEDLLDVGRIISGKLRLDVQTVELMPIVQAAIETVQPAADAKEIRIRQVLDPISGPVKGDPARLQQILWNLLSNAVKFTPKGGRIQVCLERVNSQVEVSVGDNGQGIVPEYLPRVFDRFSQADTSTTRRHGGLGLGLAVVKHLVELHGGQIFADSAGEGKGATFTVHLPIAIVRQETLGRAHPAAGRFLEGEAGGEMALGQIRLLVVDDDPDACEMLCRLLQEQATEVRTATSAREALGFLERTEFHLVISDIGMPEMDGYEFMHRVRAKGNKVPAVAVTAFARAEDRIRALQAGYNMHVAKPLEPRELMAVIASLVPAGPPSGV